MLFAFAFAFACNTLKAFVILAGEEDVASVCRSTGTL